MIVKRSSPISATVGGATETYAYDGNGAHFSRQVGANPAIRYVSDINRGLPVAIDDGSRKYVWGLGLAYAASGASLEAYHADRLGSVRAITDGSGAVIGTLRTDEWGVATSHTGASTQPFSFTGELRDGTSLIYLRARYYDPSLGRFISRDPMSGSQFRSTTLNRYPYALQNPSTYRDPSGLWTVGVCVDVLVSFFGFGGVIQGCVVASSNLQVGFTGSLGAGGAVGVPPASAGVGLVGQVSNADYIEDLGGPFYNVGGSAGAGGGVQGSAFGGLGRCGQPVFGGTFGATLTTPQAGAYGVGTGTAVLPALGNAAPSCTATKSQVLD